MVHLWHGAGGKLLHWCHKHILFCLFFWYIKFDSILTFVCHSGFFHLFWFIYLLFFNIKRSYKELNSNIISCIFCSAELIIWQRTKCYSEQQWSMSEERKTMILVAKQKQQTTKKKNNYSRGPQASVCGPVAVPGSLSTGLWEYCLRINQHAVHKRFRLMAPRC